MLVGELWLLSDSRDQDGVGFRKAPLPGGKGTGQDQDWGPGEGTLRGKDSVGLPVAGAWSSGSAAGGSGPRTALPGVLLSAVCLPPKA